MSTRPLIFIDLSSLCITDIPANFLTSAREIISKLCYLTRSSSAGTSWQSGQDLLDNFNVRLTLQYHLSVFHQFSKCDLKCRSKMEDGWVPHSAKIKTMRYFIEWNKGISWILVRFWVKCNKIRYGWKFI